MKKITLTFLFASLFVRFLSAQIINGTDTLYGNEWINFDQSYFKIMVAEDGIYRVDYQQLTSGGVPVGQVEGSQYQLFHNGEEIPIYVSSNGPFSSTDYIEFYGKKNTSELDVHLFENPDEEMMNPLYSLFTDTSAYFLTWTDVGTPLRYEEVQNDLTNLPQKEAYYMEELVMEFHNRWGQEGYNNSLPSNFNNAEGFSGPLRNDSDNDYILKPTNAYVDGDSATLKVRYATNSNTHRQQISLNGDVWKIDEFYNIDLRKLEGKISNSLLTDEIKVHFHGLASTSDKQRVSNIILIYPRAFNALNNPIFNFSINPSNEKKYIEIENFNGGPNTVYLYNISEGKKIPVIYENGTIKAVVSPSNKKRDFILLNQNSIKAPPQINKVSFIDYSQEEADYLILSNNKLFDNGQGVNRVQEYADYRSSAAGGGYETLVIDVQQLYDQFGWGINRHVLPIRNFGLYMKKNWQVPAKYLFIIGKGRTYNGVRSSAQLNNATNSSFYIPTFGNPGSDMLLMAEKGKMSPFIAIGRLPVEEPEEIYTYLKKVKQHQDLINAPSEISDRAWMKRVMHLSGGATAAEQSAIRYGLDGMANVLENSHYGAEVHSFYKSNTDPVQISTNEAIFNLINDGVSVITFFGHSAVNTFDFNIDNPDNYHNKGRYPIMFSLGCYVGGIHTPTKGVSERFVLHDEGAAIAFVASTGAGFISSLSTYTRSAYSLMGEDMYGQSIGDIVKATSEYLDSINFGDEPLVQQFTLNGDPALKASIFEGPDYIVDYSSVKLTPSIVNITADSFLLEFDIVNIGRSSTENDTIEYVIKQKLPNDEEVLLKANKSLVPINRKSIKINLPTLGEQSVGLNNLLITLDPNDEIEEKPFAAEENNDLKSPIIGSETGYPFFIQDNGAKAIYPYEFAIIGDSDLTLKASTYDPLVATQKYIFQLDTIETFDSPFLMQHEIEQSGGLLKWKPDINLQQEQVYYWRVSPDSISPVAGYNWSESSFVYLEGKEGWNQSEFGQFSKNRLDSVQLDIEKREIAFLNTFLTIRIKNSATGGAQYHTNNNPWANMYIWNVSPYKAGVQVAWLHPNSARYEVNPSPGDYGSINNKGDLPTFAFPTDTPEDRDTLMMFLENIIPDDYYVVFYTCQRNANSSYKSEEWESDSLMFGTNIFKVLEDQGAEKVRLLASGSVPYVLMYQKGKGVILEEIAADINGIVDVENSFVRYLQEGYLRSKYIGPAKNWRQLQYKLSDSNFLPTDSVAISIYGKTSLQATAQNDSLLYENVLTDDLDLSFIEPNSFPYLRLKYEAFDEPERTPHLLDNWRILYDGVPEFAIDPSQNFAYYSDTLQQGESFRVEYQIENLSKVDGDSLLIKYTFRDENNIEKSALDTIRGLNKEEVILNEFDYSTNELIALQNFGIEINPDQDQPELTNINNFLFRNFNVIKDLRNPLLDVTFDGEHIINGDIISPTPYIQISLKDENPYLKLRDTSYLNVYLKDTIANVPVRIPFNSDVMEFIAADSIGGENKASIIYQPDFEKDGLYELIVQGVDVSGNASGEFDYKVSFQISNTDAISNVVNYPNPFSTATRFLYTLTGRQIPTDYKLQIMTVSGRIVREIDELELGPLRVGTHLTDFVWDGTDQYGDRLANGVYLYRFMLNEDDNEKREQIKIEGVDKYMKAGIGKMVLIR